MRMIALLILLMLSSCQPAFALTVQPNPFNRVDVILFRGLLGTIHSTGLDQLAERLRKAGHRASALPWQKGDQVVFAAMELRPRRIALVGHSRGAAEALSVARKLEAHGLDVCLLVTLDPVGNVAVPRNVGLALNWHQGGFKSLRAGDGFRGIIRQVRLTGVAHTEIDDQPEIHDRIVSAVRSAC